ncbi:P-loop ATPase, Sll1717 family [Pseudomonas sp. PDM22]|uniref:P-loop ATPase, Sll1717 family n=1 Tax=Pseudomonas sp. PDM22 TaxID=2769287 RepID=UPI00177B4162|nr:ATPase [Pseudomonas sp. PDM22]MBD9514239.1 ATPase [Pseudomonas sp. PDM22]
MGVLNWLSKVGEVAAENDLNLHHYFYDAGISREIVVSDRMYLMLGRKGAGKTAVYKHLTDPNCDLFTKSSDIVIPLSLSSYSWNAHALLANREKAAGFEQKDSWRFILSVEVIKAFSEKLKEEGAPASKPIKKAQNILEKLFSEPTPSWFSILGEKLYSLAHIKLPSLESDDLQISANGGEVSFEEIKEDKNLLSSLNKNIDGLTIYLEQLIKTEIKDRRIFLIFDRLDEGWVDASANSCKEIISGLIHASDDYTQRFSGKVRPIIFLREDIFSVLDINDKNKHLEDFGKTLTWNQDTLEKLVLRRIKYYAGLQNIEAPSSLDELFDKTEMRNRNRPKNYILGRTFYRPRDIICFMNRLLTTMREEAQEESELLNYDTLRAEDVYSAEPGYSEWLYKELHDEWRVQRPDLFENIDSLQNIGYSIFNTDSFFDQLKSKNPEITRTNFRENLKFMYDNSIIGFKKGDNKWRFKCHRPTQGFQDEQTYKVHPGLIRHLGLKESSEDSY